MNANSKMGTVIQRFLLGTALVALSGCASHAVSKALREQAQPVMLAQVTANPGAFTGTVVIWGGRVIRTVNNTNGGSIYVLNLPLRDGEQPVGRGVSTGRFIARSKGFIDPEVFRSGVLVTVAGRITGVETEPLQKLQYPYPVVDIEELHLWYGSPYYYYYPYWGPYWGWYWR